MMTAAGVTANKFTFGIPLESAGSGGRLKAALEVFNEMCAAGVAPQTSTYNFLIEACASAPHPNVLFLNFSLYGCLLTSRNSKIYCYTMLNNKPLERVVSWHFIYP
jgi:pentatricopeptide repeat protein